MQTANDMRNDLHSFDRKVNDSMREYANEIAQLRQDLIAAHEEYRVRQGTIYEARLQLYEEEKDIINAYQKKQHDILNALALIEQAMRPDLSPMADIVDKLSKGEMLPNDARKLLGLNPIIPLQVEMREDAA